MITTSILNLWLPLATLPGAANNRNMRMKGSEQQHHDKQSKTVEGCDGTY